MMDLPPSPGLLDDARTAALLHAWQLETRVDHQGLREHLEAMPREQVLSDPEFGVLLLNSLVHTFENGGARELAREMAPGMSELGNTRLYRRFLNFQAILCFREGDLSQAVSQFSELEWLSNLSGDERTLSYAVSNSAIIFDIRCDYSEALLRYQRALAISRRLATARATGHIHHCMAMTYRQLGQYWDAQRHFERALRYALNPNEQAQNSQEQAVLHHLMGADDFAEALARRALGHFERTGVGAGLADALRVLAMVTAHGNAFAARAHLQRALDVIPSDEPLTLAETYEEMARVEGMLGDHAASAEAEARAATMYRELGAPRRAERMTLRLEEGRADAFLAFGRD